MPKKKITATSNMLEVLRAHPETLKVLRRHGMGCRHCMGAAEETVSMSAVTHGLDPELLVRELNQAVRGA